jgi:hypothetical protein
VEDCERPPETSSGRAAPNKLVFDTIASAQSIEEFNEKFLALAPREYMTSFGNIMNYANSAYGNDDQPEYVSPEFMMTDHTPEKLKDWIDGFKCGLEAGADSEGKDNYFTAKERLAIHSAVYLNA